MSATLPKAGRSFSQTFTKILLVLAPLLIGLGFGYLHLQMRKQLNEQAMVTQFGVAVNAHIVELGVAKTGTRACQAVFRYSPPAGTAVINRRMLAAPMRLCQRHKAGTDVKAWVLPADSRIFVLDEDRTNPNWSWATLILFLAFCGFAIVMFRSVLGLSRRQLRPKR